MENRLVEKPICEMVPGDRFTAEDTIGFSCCEYEFRCIQPIWRGGKEYRFELLDDRGNRESLVQFHDEDEIGTLVESMVL